MTESQNGLILLMREKESISRMHQHFYACSYILEFVTAIKNILLLYLGRNIAVNIAQFHNFSKVYVRIITVLNNLSLQTTVFHKCCFQFQSSVVNEVVGNTPKKALVLYLCELQSVFRILLRVLFGILLTDSKTKDGRKHKKNSF